MKNLLLFFIGTLIATSAFSQQFHKAEYLSNHGFRQSGSLVFDYDNDKDLDILLFPNVYINDGKGNLENIITINDTISSFEYFRTGDLNKDKKDDLVILLKDGTVMVYLQTKKGFEYQKQVETITYKPARYTDVFIADINEDKNMDIVLVGLSNFAQAYTGNGKGEFKYFYRFSSSFRRLPGMVINFDIDNDGKDELLIETIISREPHKWGLVEWKYADDTYTQGKTVNLETRLDGKLKLFDIDSDGDLDWIYPHPYLPIVYWNENKKGTLFSNIHSIDSVRSPSKFIDIDCDGDKDWISAIGSWNDIEGVYYENLGKGKFKEEYQHYSPRDLSHSFIAADFNNDGNVDLLEFKYSLFSGDQLRMRLNDGKGDFSNQIIWVTESKCDDIVLNDFDKDGITDMVGYAGERLFWHKGTKEGFSEEHQLRWNHRSMFGISMADFDNDGFDDVLWVSNDSDNGSAGWFRNNGKGNLEKEIVFHRGPKRTMGAVAIDYDHDSDVDIVVNYWKRGVSEVHLYENDGKGNFDSIGLLGSWEKKTSYLKLMDVDSDGKPNIVLIGMYWYKYESGKLVQKDYPFAKSGGIPGKIRTANIDNDKDQDFLFSYITNNPITWYEAEDTMTGPVNVIDNIRFDDCFDSGDIDGDGDNDIVAITQDYVMVADDFDGEIGFTHKYALVWLENLGNKEFKLHAIAPSTTMTQVYLHDANHDGMLDILMTDRYDPEAGIYLFLNKGN